MPYLGDAYLTLPSDGAAQASQVLGARFVVPLHFDSWTHFSNGRDSLQQAFEASGMSERLVLPDPGQTIFV